MEIRRIRPSECEALGNVLVRAYNGLPGAVRDPHYDAELRRVAERAAAVPVLVAVDRGDLLGGLTYVPRPGPFSELARDADAEIRMLGVDPDRQGRGAGRHLVEHVVALATDAGRARIVLSTSPWMRAAHALYTSLGFTRAPELDWITTTPGARYELLAFARPMGARSR